MTSQSESEPRGESFLLCATDLDTALKRFARLNKRPLSRTGFPDRELPFTERVWLPYWFVAWRLDEVEPKTPSSTDGRALAVPPLESVSFQASSSQASSSQTSSFQAGSFQTGSFQTIVCAITGTAYAVQADQQRFDERAEETASDESAPAWRLDADEAIHQSRSLAQRFLGGGRRRIRFAHLSETPSAVARWRYPLWAQTWERKRGRLDMRLLDGVTGEGCESAVRRAVLEGLLTSKPLG